MVVSGGGVPPGVRRLVVVSGGGAPPGVRRPAAVPVTVPVPVTYMCVLIYVCKYIMIRSTLGPRDRTHIIHATRRLGAAAAFAPSVAARRQAMADPAPSAAARRPAMADPAPSTAARRPAMAGPAPSAAARRPAMADPAMADREAADRRNRLTLRLRAGVQQLRQDFNPISNLYPATDCALHGLEEALIMDFPVNARKRKWTPHTDKRKRRDKGRPTARKVRLTQMKLGYWRVRCAALRARIKHLTTTKETTKQGQHCRSEWLVAVALSHVTNSQRSYADMFQDICPADDQKGFHRKTIMKILDAFVEVVKELNEKEVEDVVSASVAVAAGLDGFEDAIAVRSPANRSPAQEVAMRAISCSTPIQKRRPRPGSLAAAASAVGAGAPTTPAASRAAGMSAATSPAAARAVAGAGAEASPGAAPGTGRSAREGEAALRALRTIHLVTCLHVQDEAGLGLRSFLAGLDHTSRSRTTKVQSHVVRLTIDGVAMDFPSELDPLANKQADTLATSLLRVRDRAIAVVLRGIGDNPTGEVWFWHVIVGDGVSSNGRAGRIIATHARDSPPGAGRIHYFLMVIVCAVHMGNLVTKNAVHGPAALLGVRESKAVRCTDDPAAARKEAMGSKSLPFKATKVIVQLYKYLVPQYYDEFYGGLQQAVAQFMVLHRLPQSRAAHCAGLPQALAAAAQCADNLRKLYGPRVLPDDVLACCSGGLQPMAYILSPEDEILFLVDPQAVRRRICGSMVEAGSPPNFTT